MNMQEKPVVSKLLNAQQSLGCARQIILPLVEDMARRAQQMLVNGKALLRRALFWRQPARLTKRSQRPRLSRAGHALAAGALAVSMISGALAAPSPVRADALVVTNTADSGTGSLREAVDASNLDEAVTDTITFSSDLTGQTILLTGPLYISDDVMIEGPGSENLTISSQTNQDALTVNSRDGITIDVTISGLTLSTENELRSVINNNTENLTLTDIVIDGSMVEYSAIQSIDGNLILQDSVISNNTSQGSGGGLYARNGSVNIAASTISGNQAGSDAILGPNGVGVISLATLGAGGGAFFSGADVSITDGSQIINNHATVSGGGVYSAYGPLTVSDSVISGNQVGSPKMFYTYVEGSEYGLFTSGLEGRGGGVFFFVDTNYQSTLSLEINNSVIQSNSATSSGGGMYMVGGVLDVHASTISGNHSGTTDNDNQPATYFGIDGAGGGVFLYYLASSSIEGSTISQNTSTDRGGGIFSDYQYGTGLSLVNDTISGNTAVNGGGLYLVEYLQSTTIAHTTITGNTASGSGGGIYASASSSDWTVAQLVDSIVANNQAAYSGTEDLGGTSVVFDVDFSLIQSAPASLINELPGSVNLFGVDAKLGPLGDHGGPTFTHVPAIDSPVIDAGDPDFIAPPAFDQRGYARVALAHLDMGAVEYAAGTIGFTSASSTVNEDAGTVTLTVARTGGSDGALTVDYAASSSDASAGSDYTALSGTLTWADGETANKTIVLTILDDLVPETNESVTVTLSNVSGTGQIGIASYVVTIVDNDDVVVDLNPIYLPLVTRP